MSTDVNVQESEKNMIPQYSKVSLIQANQYTSTVLNGKSTYTIQNGLIIA